MTPEPLAGHTMIVWAVEVVEEATGKVVRSISCLSESAADRVERGVLINLNYDDFYTRIVQKDTP